MSKARLLGMKASYIPNSKADMRRRKKVYQRGWEIPGKAQIAAQERRKKEGEKW